MVIFYIYIVVNGDIVNLFCGGERGIWYIVKVIDVVIVINGICWNRCFKFIIILFLTISLYIEKIK